MKNKKIICAFIASFLCVTAVSCGNSEEKSESSTDNSSESSASESVAESETEPESETETEPETESESETETEPESDDDTAESMDFQEYITSTEVTPPLWKVTDPETNNELYIMGTVHVLPENFTEFPDYIMDIYENSDGIAVEYDTSIFQTDIRALIAFQQSFLYDDGTTVKDHISEENYNNAKAFLEDMGTYVEELDQYSASYWYNQIVTSMLLNVENLSSTGVDASFIDYAHNDGKEIVNIENISSQVNAINAYSDELVDYLFSDLFNELDNDYDESLTEAVKSLAELYDQWAIGDVDPMLDSDTEQMDELPEELVDDYEEYMNTMLYNRNKDMAEKASQFIKDGKNYLFMVGSMHYAGDKGVDDLLAEMGYTVEKIS